MNERAPALDDTTMKIGLLMESAQAHQKLAESHLGEASGAYPGSGRSRA